MCSGTYFSRSRRKDCNVHLSRIMCEKSGVGSQLRIPNDYVYSMLQTNVLLGEPGGQLTDVDLVPVCS